MSAVRRLAPLALALAFAVAGCASPPQVTLAANGYKAGAESKDLECGRHGNAQARVTYAAEGVGRLHVTVTDGVGGTVHEAGAPGQPPPAAEAMTQVGPAGTWTLRVDAGYGYTGQWAVTLIC